MKSRLAVSGGICALLVAAVAGSLWQAAVILRNRPEIARLRAAVLEQRKAPAAAADAGLASAPAAVPRTRRAGPGETDVSLTMNESIHVLLRRVGDARRWFEANPAQRIPEMRYLSDHDWIETVAEADLTNPDGERHFAAGVRLAAMRRFASNLKSALERYAVANRGMLPVDVSELAPLLPDHGDPSLLDRYEMLVSGTASSVAAQNLAIGPKPASVVDPEIDSVVYVGPPGGITVRGNGALLEIAAGRAKAAYANAHGGELPPDLQAVLPYFKDPADAQRYYESHQKPNADATRTFVERTR